MGCFLRIVRYVSRYLGSPRGVFRIRGCVPYRQVRFTSSVDGTLRTDRRRVATICDQQPARDLSKRDEAARTGGDGCP